MICCDQISRELLEEIIEIAAMHGPGAILNKTIIRAAFWHSDFEDKVKEKLSLKAVKEEK